MSAILGPHSRQDWVRGLSALATKFLLDVALSVTKKQPLRSAIIAAADRHRYGWYDNRAILRCCLLGPAEVITGQGTWPRRGT